MGKNTVFRGRIILLTLGVLLCALAWLQDHAGISMHASLLFIVIGAFCLVAWLKWKAWRRWKAIKVSQIDGMTGTEFEQFLGKIMTHRGYRVTLNGASGDLGVDLIARKDKETLAIQAKRQAGKVSRRAVSDAVAGMQHYKCTSSMVISNAYYSPGAKALAQSTGCILIDRSALTRWIQDFQQA
jgi:restriction system protein